MVLLVAGTQPSMPPPCFPLHWTSFALAGCVGALLSFWVLQPPPPSSLPPHVTTPKPTPGYFALGTCPVPSMGTPHVKCNEDAAHEHSHTRMHTPLHTSLSTGATSSSSLGACRDFVAPLGSPPSLSFPSTPVAGCWLLVACYWLLVACCLLLVAGCWLLVAGCWLLVAGC